MRVACFLEEGFREDRGIRTWVRNGLKRKIFYFWRGGSRNGELYVGVFFVDDIG